MILFWTLEVTISEDRIFSTNVHKCFILSYLTKFSDSIFGANHTMKCFFNRYDVAMARGVFPVEVGEEPVILGRGDPLGIEENCVSREHAELRSISCGLMILKCTHRYLFIMISFLEVIFLYHLFLKIFSTI